MSFKLMSCVGGIVLALGFSPGPALGTALDTYVAAPEPNYTYSLANTIGGAGYTAYVLDMKSQNWRDEPNEVNRSLWQHWVIVVKPDTVVSNKALLWVHGGSNDNGGPPPGSVDSDLADIATSTNTVTVRLRYVPNQRIKFADETDPRYIADGRLEDELLAYTWDKFLQTGDGNWPGHLPMAKAAVKAMDTVTAFCAGLGETVDEFVVTGASKRGWTTWLTAAADPNRVVAIIPVVIDVLNVEVSMTHHYAAYGYWAPAIEDYEDMKIMDWFGTPELAALWAITDPCSYHDRYTMPKYMINSSGDDFFLPDSSQFYFDDLPGEKYLRYIPNTDHGLNGYLPDSLKAYYQAIVSGTARPQFSWTLEPDGSIHVQTITSPTTVKLWQATNAVARDFRKNPYLPGWIPTGYAGPVWSSSNLSDVGGGLYIGAVSEPPAGWTAFFVELTFPSGGANPFTFTTEVRVVPEAATLTLKVKKRRHGEVTEVDPNYPRHFRPDDTVTLTAVPNGNKVFEYWQIFHPNHPGDANYAVTDANNPVMILMGGDRKVIAKFKCGGGVGEALPALVIGLAVCGVVSRRRRRRR